MARITTVRTTGRECPCGGVARAGLRYEATRTVNVLICWECGRETPPLYGPTAVTSSAYCRYCGERFTPTDPRQRYCPDRDCADRAGRITLDRRHLGGRLSRRPA